MFQGPIGPAGAGNMSLCEYKSFEGGSIGIQLDTPTFPNSPIDNEV